MGKEPDATRSSDEQAKPPGVPIPPLRTKPRKVAAERPLSPAGRTRTPRIDRDRKPRRSPPIALPTPVAGAAPLAPAHCLWRARRRIPGPRGLFGPRIAAPRQTFAPDPGRLRVVSLATLTIVRADPTSGGCRRGGRAAEGARLESVYTGNRIEGSNPSPSAKQARGVRLWRRKGAAGYPNGLICLPLWIPRRPLRRRHGSLEPPAGAVRRALRLWLAVSPPSSGDERSALAQSTSWGRRLVTAWI